MQGPIAGWKVDAGRLVVTPLEPVETTLSVQVELSAPPSDELVSPLLVPADSHRTLLLTKAALRGDGLLELTDPGAVRATSETEAAGLSDDVRGAPGGLVAVLDPARPPRWRAEWADRTQVLAAQVDRLLGRRPAAAGDDPGERQGALPDRRAPAVPGVGGALREGEAEVAERLEKGKGPETSRPHLDHLQPLIEELQELQ